MKLRDEDRVEKLRAVDVGDERADDAGGEAGEADAEYDSSSWLLTCPWLA